MKKPAKVQEDNSESKSDEYNKFQSFESKIETMQTKPKPFINYGPTMVNKELHATKSNLLLYVNDQDELRAFRAEKDPYQYSTNYSDLPEFIDDTQQHKDSDLLGLQKSRGTLDQNSLLKHQLIYNEEMQVNLHKLRNVKVFKEPLDVYNRRVLNMKEKKLPNIFKREQRIIKIDLWAKSSTDWWGSMDMGFEKNEIILWFEYIRGFYLKLTPIN